MYGGQLPILEVAGTASAAARAPLVAAVPCDLGVLGPKLGRAGPARVTRRQPSPRASPTSTAPLLPGQAPSATAAGLAARYTPPRIPRPNVPTAKARKGVRGALPRTPSCTPDADPRLAPSVAASLLLRVPAVPTSRTEAHVEAAAARVGRLASGAGRAVGPLIQLDPSSGALAVREPPILPLATSATITNTLVGGLLLTLPTEAFLTRVRQVVTVLVTPSRTSLPEALGVSGVTPSPFLGPEVVPASAFDRYRSIAFGAETR